MRDFDISFGGLKMRTLQRTKAVLLEVRQFGSFSVMDFTIYTLDTFFFLILWAPNVMK